MDHPNQKGRGKLRIVAGRRKKTRRHPRRILGMWARLGLLGMAIIVLGIAAVGLVAKAIHPYREGAIQARQLAETDRQIAELQSDNAALKGRIAYEQTPEGIVTEARKIGYQRPGEIPIIIEGGSSRWNENTVAEPTKHTPSFGERAAQLWHKLIRH